MSIYIIKNIFFEIKRDCDVRYFRFNRFTIFFYKVCHTIRKLRMTDLI